MQTRTGLSMAAVLFTDIEGSSRLWETARAEMDRVLAEHDRRLRAVVESHGGVIFATVGDGFGVAFETVSAAVAAARAARDGIADLLVAGEQLRVRMGIHVGEVSNREGDVFGPTVNRCARLMDLAWGGQIVVSDAAARLCVDDPELVDLGVYVLRGLSEPERVHQLGNGSFPPLRARPWSPLEAPRLVGRDLLIDQVVEELERHRLVTLVGPVGVGKSALAHASAAEIHRRGGVCVVADVNHDDDPDGIVWGIASQAAGGRRLAGDPLAAIGAALSPSAGVVILDGCQERCPSVVDAVRRLLDGTTVRVLAASRRGFGLPRERCVRVDPLAVPDSAAPGEATSVEFLVQEAARHGIEVTDSELPDLGRIASALGGLPLALELAAGKLAVLSARELADRLDAEGGTALLGGTLTRIVDDAVDALTADTRGLLACLSVCRGSFSLDTALAVSGCPEEAVVDGLEELADHAIVTVDSSGGTRRYRIHEPVRRRVLASQDSYEVRRRHAVHQLEIARQAKDLTNTDEAAGLALLDVEYRQCGDALEWAVEAEEAGIGLELASALRWYWWARGCPTAVPGWLDRLLAADRTGVAPEIVAEGLQTAGTLAYRHQVSTARRLLDEAVQVFASVVDGGDAGPGLVFAYSRALLSAGAAAAADGDLSMATILFGDARYHATRAGDAQTAGIALMNMAQVFVEDDDLDMAARVADEAGDLLRASGTPSRRAESLEIRGEIALLRHDWDTAIELLELAREIAQHYGYLPSFHETSALLAEAYLFAGRPHEARAAACEVVTDSIGPGRGAAQALAVVARMACEEGDERGFTTAGVALAMVDHLGDETTRRSVSRILDGVIDRTRPRVAERESDGRRLPWSAVVDLVCGPSPLTSQ